MTDEQFRAYARRGLTSRLDELDRERATIVTLLAQVTSDTTGTESPAPRQMSAEARQRIGDAARRRWAARREERVRVAAAETPEIEVARVLPRRGRARDNSAPEAAV